MTTLLRNLGIDEINVTVVTDNGTIVDQFDVDGDYEAVQANMSTLTRSRRYVLAIIKALRLESQGQ